jgi:hypothetical protein
MSRIHNDNSAPTHPQANEWLSDFVIDVKKMMLKANYQPFTMERLNEWSGHRSDIESCWDFESSQIKRLSDNPVYEHSEAIMYFNGLVVDLKLLLIEEEVKAITAERLKDVDTHYFEIVRCRKNQRIYY